MRKLWFFLFVLSGEKLGVFPFVPLATFNEMQFDRLSFNYKTRSGYLTTPSLPIAFTISKGK
jgi:hypothetical protein